MNRKDHNLTTENQVCSAKDSGLILKPSTRQDFIVQVVKGIRRLQTEGREWERGWRPVRFGLLPFNPYTGNYYRGLNAIWLLMVSVLAGYHDNRWLTCAQKDALGKRLGKTLRIRKGEQGTHITGPQFGRDKGKAPIPRIKTVNEDSKLAEELITNFAYTDDTPDGFHVYSVFNAEQIEGMPAWDDGGPMTRIKRNNFLERFLASSGVIVKHAQSRRTPAYSPRLDRVFMPYPGRFRSGDEYYAAKLHEFYHATSHRSRENRDCAEISEEAGYNLEEIRAEIFSVMAGRILGLPSCEANAASYIDWYEQRVPKGAPSLLKLASQAGTVLVYIAEYAAGRAPRASWFPAKRSWKELIVTQRELDKGLPGFGLYGKERP